MSETGYSAFFFVNDFLSIFFMTTLCLMPIFLLAFYCKKFKSLGDKDF